jgi:hypothetical protein
MTAYYKALRAGRRGTHTEFTWPEPGEWVEVDGELVACKNGLHVCRLDQIIDWLHEDLWLVEVDEAAGLIDHGDKMVARRVRLVEQVTAWDERSARLLAAGFAERVLHLFEQERPGDTRPRDAIAAARAFANGEIGAAARDAARDAAWDAAWAAAGDAAGAASRDASWAAEREWQTAYLAATLGLSA